MTDIIFRSVKVQDYDPEMPVDVLVANGLVSAIDNIPALPGAQEIDCAGLWMLPGAIDMHVHFREPGATHKENMLSGARAAVLGGVTTVADMPNNTPPIVTRAAFLDKAALADAVDMCDLRLYMGLTADNIDEIASVAAHPRFAGIKVFLGATTGSMLCDMGTVERAARRLDCLFVFHAESEAVLRAAAAAYGPGTSAADHLTLRPVEAAVDAVRRIASVFSPGMRFHICHVSTTAELDIINSSGGITCETAPHYLTFSAQKTEVAGNFARMNPPLRTESDRAALFNAMVAGRIDCLATDHAPHLPDEKLRPWPAAPSGVPGVETLVPWTLRQFQLGHINISAAIRLLSERPAAILGLADRGRIAPGLRADLMLWDPESTWEVRNEDIASMCGWSLFDGMVLAGRPIHACVAGKLVY